MLVLFLAEARLHWVEESNSPTEPSHARGTETATQFNPRLSVRLVFGQYEKTIWQ